ncbi:MAG: recombinase family protein [Candidatus Binatia bacterium]|jgi:DNA invertase Pin-like site-specific DNA recombinase
MASTVKAVSYLRVSGKGQVDGDRFPRQRETIARYARAAGFEIVDEYRDEGVSGTKDLEAREGLSDLLARIRANGVRVVLVERADRLARDLIVSELILNQVRQLGVKVIAADGGTELTAGDDDPTRTLIRQVLGAVAQFEKAVIVSKLKAARMRKRRTEGRCEGRKPYGTRPGEAEVVSLIHKLRRKPRGGERLSFAAIAERLNAEGHPTRTGKPWAPQTVRQIAGRRG